MKQPAAARATCLPQEAPFPCRQSCSARSQWHLKVASFEAVRGRCWPTRQLSLAGNESSNRGARCSYRPSHQPHTQGNSAHGVAKHCAWRRSQSHDLNQFGVLNWPTNDPQCMGRESTPDPIAGCSMYGEVIDGDRDQFWSPWRRLKKVSWGLRFGVTSSRPESEQARPQCKMAPRSAHGL